MQYAVNLPENASLLFYEHVLDTVVGKMHILSIITISIHVVLCVYNVSIFYSVYFNVRRSSDVSVYVMLPKILFNRKSPRGLRFQ